MLRQDRAVLQRTPEVLVMVLADALRYCAALFPSLIFQGSADTMDDIFSFLFTFANDSELVSNPYTRAYLVKVIYGFTPHRQTNASAPLPSPLLGTGKGRAELVPFLFRFFVDMEHVGEGDAFYNKFNYRYFALTIIEYLWRSADVGLHKQSLRKLANDEPKEWLKFLNLLLNDLHYGFSVLLEEFETAIYVWMSTYVYVYEYALPYVRLCCCTYFWLDACMLACTHVYICVMCMYCVQVRYIFCTHACMHACTHRTSIRVSARQHPTPHSCIRSLTHKPTCANTSVRVHVRHAPTTHAGVIWRA